MELPLTLALFLPWAIVAFQAWLIAMLFRQHGRTLLGQDDLRQQLARLQERVDQLSSRADLSRAGDDDEEPAAEEGLPIGSPAPDFELPDLEGSKRSLRDFLGQPLVVTFFSPQCGFCMQMAPRLGQLPADSPRMLLVSQGDVEEHRKLAREHNWQNVDVVFQDNWEVSNAYQANGTPVGYLLDAEGRIASGLAIGAEALLRLRPGAATAPGGSGQTNGSAAVGQEAGGSDGRVARSGLPVGSMAPEFSLPDLEGTERSLNSFRGKRVLLVFSEPDCEPCRAIAPRLLELQRRGRPDDPAVLLISRGEAEANRAEAQRGGFDFPVLLQQGWEVSRQYGAFATPVAYLIDEQGAVASEMAVGPEAIRKLV